MGKVAASVTSRRRGCNEASVVYVNPSVNPPHGVLPAPRPGSLLGAVQTRRTVPYPSRSDRFNGVTGGAGGPKGRNRNLPWPPCKKGYKDAYLLFIFLTPQSIAKPSPGWNKVALLTAVRNSPCSCPFSVSLHPPLAALNSVPLRGAIVSMGLRGIQGGLRGEIEIFPGPPAKRL